MQRGKKVQPPYFLGYDLGGTKLASAVCDAQGRIVDRHVEPVEFGKGIEGFVEFLSKRAQSWVEKYPQVKALGIASCGPLDIERGILLQPTNFPRWGNIPIKKPLEKNLKIPVLLQNDAAAAAMAEGWRGAAKKSKNWIVLTLGTGLGTGIIMNRQVFMGGSGLGPEAGHMIVTDKKYLCGCGNYGCAEAVLSGTGLSRRILDMKLPFTDTRALVSAAKSGNSQARNVFEEYSQILGRLIHNLAVMYKPEGIYLAGGLAEENELFLDAARRIAKDLLTGRPGFMPLVELSRLKNDIGVLGGVSVLRAAPLWRWGK